MKYPHYFITGIFVYPAYLLFNFAVDLRIEQLRQPINDNAIRIAAQAAVTEYKKIYTENETLLEKKRKVRDRKLEVYADKLDRILELK